jgi:hypothetical protein
MTGRLILADGEGRAAAEHSLVIDVLCQVNVPETWHSAAIPCNLNAMFLY